MPSHFSGALRLCPSIRATINARFYIVLWCLTPCVVSCVSTRGSTGEPSAVSFHDPDPDNDPDAPQLCNPTGKTGVELASCQEHNNAYFGQFEAEAKKREPWFNFPQDSWLDSNQVDAKYLALPLQESEAITRLEAAPFIELSPADVRYFTGTETSFPGRKAYLVRGLLYAKNGGVFSVFEKNSSIYVRHEVEGASAQAETRSAVIVWLPQRPPNLYVDCQVTE